MSAVDCTRPEWSMTHHQLEKVNNTKKAKEIPFWFIAILHVPAEYWRSPSMVITAFVGYYLPRSLIGRVVGVYSGTASSSNLLPELIWTDLVFLGTSGRLYCMMRAARYIFGRHLSGTRAAHPVVVFLFLLPIGLHVYYFFAVSVLIISSLISRRNCGK